ncbi:MAG: M23 family metallopeptidase [Actinomycetaceae bacterium]|nr:M23 family metallopeptidase [Arcanobacterium sp.]MDD7686931.1 M23 family metallopeptidase [Actinomycetaceae bacterium]MDY5273756.1 M23 family metallopeptidase [Arcanobacterium sp.]
MRKVTHGCLASGRHAVAASVLGAVVTLLVIAGVSIDHSSHAQAVASHSVLSSSVLEKDAGVTPHTLTESKHGQALAVADGRVAVAQELANDRSAVCTGFSEGASSVVKAYVPEDASAVYRPMAQGSYYISSPFGNRLHPITHTYTMHSGVDMAGPAGTPIYAVADGVVLSTTEAGANNGIVIEHHVNGQVFTSWYLHSYASDIRVNVGDEVKAGQVIALRGSAGQSTGAHLHFEMHHGAGLDTSASEPLSFLEDLGAMWVGESCKP